MSWPCRLCDASLNWVFVFHDVNRLILENDAGKRSVCKALLSLAIRRHHGVVVLWAIPWTGNPFSLRTESKMLGLLINRLVQDGGAMVLLTSSLQYRLASMLGVAHRLKSCFINNI